MRIVALDSDFDNDDLVLDVNLPKPPELALAHSDLPEGGIEGAAQRGLDAVAYAVQRERRRRAGERSKGGTGGRWREMERE